MPIKIVQNGTEAEILPAMRYLERQYGIPAGHIRSVRVEAEVGKPLAITVTVYVQEEEEPMPAHEPLGLAEEQRWTSDMHEAIDSLWGRKKS